VRAVQKFRSKILKYYFKKEEKRMELIKRFLKEEEGVTAIEYGLIAALIAVAIITILIAVGTSLNDIFTRVNNGLNGA
jgi:pilus assembly protein Flp/PilA